MDLINGEDIEKMMEILNPVLDETTLIHIDDEGLSKLLRQYWFLQQCAQDIVEKFPFSYEVVLYSQYYWFVNFKNQYFLQFGYDGDMDQQKFLLIEKISNELDEDVDWDLIEDIEEQITGKL
ncbi:hypothetical protein ACIQAA_08800 [Neobacillus sp. NPDC093182]|uniref:hypothetical protein n=1 Tax=Neobacillus sp. NPDC093182 TaxID=3364297 RepID=UPI0037F1AE32